MMRHMVVADDIHHISYAQLCVYLFVCLPASFLNGTRAPDPISFPKRARLQSPNPNKDPVSISMAVRVDTWAGASRATSVPGCRPQATGRAASHVFSCGLPSLPIIRVLGPSFRMNIGFYTGLTLWRCETAKLSMYCGLTGSIDIRSYMSVVPVAADMRSWQVSPMCMAPSVEL